MKILSSLLTIALVSVISISAQAQNNNKQKLYQTAPSANSAPAVTKENTEQKAKKKSFKEKKYAQPEVKKATPINGQHSFNNYPSSTPAKHSQKTKSTEFKVGPNTGTGIPVQPKKTNNLDAPFLEDDMESFLLEGNQM